MRFALFAFAAVRSLAVLLLVTLAALLSPRVTLADCAHCTVSISSYSEPEVIVGSPSGLARPFYASVTLTGFSTSIPEFWVGYDLDNLQSMGGKEPPRSYTSTGGDLHCGEELCGDLSWPYQQLSAGGTNSASGTFYPRFGSDGSKYVLVQFLTQCSGGYAYGSLPNAIVARSTDFDADGDTDQNDKVAIERALYSGSTDQRFNLNTDLLSNTVVDTADYNVVLNEMKRAAPDTMCECAVNQTDGSFPAAKFVPSRLADTSPPRPANLNVVGISGSTVTIQWVSPGDDTDDYGHGYHALGVPAEYDLRYSASPITAENFASGTRVTSGVPAPLLAYSTQSADVSVDCNKRYWMLKAIDAFGNSSYSNCLDMQRSQTVSDLTFCATFKTCALIGFTAPVSPDTIFDLRWSSTAITDQCTFESATPISPVLDLGIMEAWITNLSQNHDYYAAVRTRAANSAWSAISNVASTHTPTVGSSCNQSVICSGDGMIATLPQTDEVTRLSFNVSNAFEGVSGSMFAYAIPSNHAGEPLRLEVFDAAGRRVISLLNGSSQSGTFATRWDHRTDAGTKAHAGVYFARLTVGGQQLKRTVLVKD